MSPRKKSDPRGQHVRIYNDILDSVAWRVLSYSEQALYLALRRDLNSFNNGNISATLSTLKHRGFRSSATLAKGLRTLVALGFIFKTRPGGIALGRRACCLYAFSDMPVHNDPKVDLFVRKPTFTFQSFKTISQARQALREAEQDTPAKRSRPDRSSGVQSLNRADSASEAQVLRNGSDSAAGGSESMH